MRAKRLTVQQRREIFQNLVEQQDHGLSVPESREQVVRLFKITDAQLKQIEDEGVEKEWPPLNDEPVVTVA